MCAGGRRVPAGVCLVCIDLVVVVVDVWVGECMGIWFVGIQSLATTTSAYLYLYRYLLLLASTYPYPLPLASTLTPSLLLMPWVSSENW